MNIYFSATTRGFYFDGIHDILPPDAVKVTAAERAELLAIAYPVQHTIEELAANARAQRDQLLRVADKLVCTVEDNGGDTSALRAWRTALRNVPEASGFPEAIAWPAPPSGITISDADAATISSVMGQ